jgi:hypothetical protein
MNLLASIAVIFALLQVAPPSIPATFTGIYRGVESGRVVIEVESGQSMRMFVTGSTKFIRDGKPSKASQFHDGDAVTVDAERDMRMNLVALRVEAVKPKTPKPAGDSAKPDTEKLN